MGYFQSDFNHLKQKLHSHILFQSYETIRELCLPLLKINTTGFIFIRRFPNGDFIDLSNQLEWSEYFLQRYLSGQYLSKDIQDHMLIETGVSLWDLNPNNIIWQEGMKEFDFGHGVSIVRPSEDYTDVFCFYTDYNNQFMTSFYAANLDVLNQFADYFIEKVEYILSDSLHTQLSTPKIYLGEEEGKPDLKSKLDFDQGREGLLNLIDPEYKSLSKKLLNNPLTAREKDCLIQCAKGLSAKEVARELGISYRTVEIHIKNAKLKCGCSSVSRAVYLMGKYCSKFSQKLF